ncbi:peptide ABC transporter substrate-binding protein [Priestia taiwanensis]|uniref:Peptide ABC transporter substrate-binding protein n=1 Tax=Priestia taiwanensis TaxID=1347902 RepID=A0A917ELH9_9BACI|nr:peptide ABC transporter substrate-binding protein [Priestia taiwanensis]MBM7361882.1 oligopeptide transport system substrate-binding protein [Priestia taiwanensis]GGE57673.1 peptide ABC transporter substrate-binding protein [Priestia taiwanensis]
MKKKWSILTALVFMLSVFLVACGSTGEKEESNGKGKGDGKLAAKQVLKTIETSNLPSLDPAIATDAVSFLALNNVMEGLYRLGEGDKLVPGVAEKHDVSPDGKKYTFMLRKDAKWSNGKPVIAKDFEFAWKRAIDPATKSKYAYIMGDIKNANKIMAKEAQPSELGVKAVNDTTLEVELETAIPYFDKLTTFGTFMPLNEEFVKAQGNKYALEATTALYNGPFVLTDWVQEKGWTYKKNDQYWDKATVKLEEIQTNVVKEIQTRVNMYNTNEADFSVISGDVVKSFKDKPDLGAREEATTFFLRMNQKKEALANKNVRKAIALAFDKKSYAEELLGDGSKPIDALVPGNWAKGPDTKTGKDFRETNGNLSSYNVAEAQKAWEAAKKELGKDEVAIELLSSDTEVGKRTAEYLQGQLQKNLPGLKINVKIQPFKQQLELVDKMEYDISYGGWGPDYEDPMTFLDMFITDNSHNSMGFSNAKYDDLIKKSKVDLLSDLPKRWESLLEAEKILVAEEYAIAPVYQRARAYVLRPNVKGLVSHKIGGDYSYKWVSIVE